MGTLLAAVCLLLVDALEMLKSFGILCGGDSGGVAAREIRVAVREVDRRVLLVHVGAEVWAHILCVESDWPRSQTFHSSEQSHRRLFCSFPTRSMTPRVVTENR